MFLVARPYAHPYTHPYAHHSAAHPYEHAQSPFDLSLDSAYGYEQHLARRRHDELVRQRARAAVARAQQRREYERQLAIQATEEEMFLQHVARICAQEEYRRELMRQEQLRQVEEARRAQRQRQLSAMRVAMAQRAIYAALEQVLAEATDVVPMVEDKPEVAQKQPSAAPQSQSLADSLQSRAQNEQDPEVLLTLNGLLQALASGSLSSSPQPTPTARPEPTPSQETVVTPQTAAAPTPASVPIDIISADEPLPARPVSPALSTSSHSTSIAALDAISTSLRTLTSDFVLPPVDFTGSASSTDSRPSSPSTHLPYTTANQPIHAYEAALGKLLDRLDAIESEGDEEIRAQRKSLVLQVEEKLRELDEAIEQQRREHGLASIPEPVSSTPEGDVEMAEELAMPEVPEVSAEPGTDVSTVTVDADMDPVLGHSGSSTEADIVPETLAPVEGDLAFAASEAMEVEAAAPTPSIDVPAVQDLATTEDGVDILPNEPVQNSVVDSSDATSVPSPKSPGVGELSNISVTLPNDAELPTVPASLQELSVDITRKMGDDESLVAARLSPLPEDDAMSDFSAGSDLEVETETAGSSQDDRHQADVPSAAPYSETLEEDWLDIEA